MPLLTLERAATVAAYPLKSLIEDRAIIRNELGLPDLISPPEEGRQHALPTDDTATVCGHAVLRRAGYPVKLAGGIMSRVREAMREYPDEPQFTVVLLANGSWFARPTSMLDLSSGYMSGGYFVAATIIEVRNLREHVLRSIEAYEPEAEDVAA